MSTTTASVIDNNLFLTLSAPTTTKWSNTLCFTSVFNHCQTHSVFNHFVGLALKGLNEPPLWTNSLRVSRSNIFLILQTKRFAKCLYHYLGSSFSGAISKINKPQEWPDDLGPVICKIMKYLTCFLLPMILKKKQAVLLKKRQISFRAKCTMIFSLRKGKFSNTVYWFCAHFTTFMSLCLF